MSYLLDRKIKRKKFLGIILVVVFLVILIYFRSGIFYRLSYVSHLIFRPVLILGNNLGDKFINIKSYFISKNSLYMENQILQSKLTENQNKMSNYNSVLSENINLKEILGRASLQTEKKDMILATILSSSNQSIYNSIVINVGTNQGIKTGDIVFALGNIPIGRISEVYPDSSKVVLFSSAGEKTQAIISGKNIFMEIIGRGGGNFEMRMPQDFTLVKGDQVVLPGIIPFVLGIVETTISDPRDTFQKVLLISPVNIQELKFVEVES